MFDLSVRSSEAPLRTAGSYQKPRLVNRIEYVILTVLTDRKEQSGTSTFKLLEEVRKIKPDQLYCPYEEALNTLVRDKLLNQALGMDHNPPTMQIFRSESPQFIYSLTFAGEIAQEMYQTWLLSADRRRDREPAFIHPRPLKVVAHEILTVLRDRMDPRGMSIFHLKEELVKKQLLDPHKNIDADLKMLVCDNFLFYQPGVHHHTSTTPTPTSKSAQYLYALTFEGENALKRSEAWSRSEKHEPFSKYVGPLIGANAVESSRAWADFNEYERLLQWPVQVLAFGAANLILNVTNKDDYLERRPRPRKNDKGPIKTLAFAVAILLAESIYTYHDYLRWYSFQENLTETTPSKLQAIPRTGYNMELPPENRAKLREAFRTDSPKIIKSDLQMRTPDSPPSLSIFK